MTKTLLEEYLPAYSKQLACNSELKTKIELLEKKLEIAMKALKYYTREDAYVSCFGNPVHPNPMVARQALKEMEEVK